MHTFEDKNLSGFESGTNKKVEKGLKADYEMAKNGK